ncbi:MAG: hypothetical protein E6R03_03835 [Hyphomicrobiaceae bacterium]|nr:MAG: hypothetical protein E6R03_03835 [Hyphomicrobiaceae bacterium]
MLSALSTINAKVSITRPVVTLDAVSSRVNTFKTVAQFVPVELTTQTATEPVQYGGPRGTRTGFAVFPFNNDVRPQDRLVYGQRVLEVQGVQVMPNNEDGTTSFMRINWKEIDESPINSNVVTNPEPPT